MKFPQFLSRFMRTPLRKSQSTKKQPVKPPVEALNGVEPTEEIGSREGDICPELNKKIVSLIINSDKFLVFLDEDFYVQWVERGKIAYPRNYSQVMNRVSYLETISTTHFSGVPTELRELEEFRRLLGEGVARVFDEDAEAASDILDKAELLLKDRSVQRARIWYLTAAALASCIFASIGAILWLFRNNIRPFLGLNAFDVILCTCAGAVGALVSTIIRVRDVNLNASSGPILHYIEGVARIVVGVTGAFLVSLAIKANLFLGAAHLAATSSIHLAWLATICFVAGTSERLVPSLIKQIETTSTPTDEEPPRSDKRRGSSKPL